MSSPVSSAPHSTHVPNGSNPVPPSSPRGISDAGSSIRSSQSAEGSGFCAWLGKTLNKIWSAIKACFCFGPTESAGQVENAETRLNNRIAKGEEVLNRCLGDESFNQVAENRSVGVVVLQYNNNTLASFGPLTARERLKQDTRAQLRHLLREAVNCEDGTLSIKTMIFQKNDANSFDYYHKDSRIQFPSGDSTGTGGGHAERIGMVNVCNLLRTAIPNQVPANAQTFIGITHLLHQLPLL